MDRKTLKRTLDSLDLHLVSVKNGTGNASDIVLRAPDGVEQKFMITRLDDPHSDRTNITQMRHFARDHQRSHDLPTMVEIDVLNVTPKPITDMELASRAVVYATDPRVTESLERKLEHNGTPINLNNALVTQAGKPIEPEPVPNLAEKLQALAKTFSNPKPPKKTMAKPNLKTVPVTTAIEPAAAPAPRKRASDRRLEQVEFFKLCTLLNETDMRGIASIGVLQKKLSNAFGKDLATSTVHDALKATGKRLDIPKAGMTAAEGQIILAREMVRLIRKLGDDVSAELLELAGE